MVSRRPGTQGNHHGEIFSCQARAPRVSGYSLPNEGHLGTHPSGFCPGTSGYFRLEHTGLCGVRTRDESVEGVPTPSSPEASRCSPNTAEDAP